MANALSNTQILTAIGLPVTIADELATAQGKSFEAVSNQFLDALVNKICYQRVENMNFTNPFKKYDSFPIAYGDTIENVYIDKAMGNVFDKDATDPFAKTAPVAKSMYAKINYEMQYPITIQDSLLRRAALNTYGFQSLVEAILHSMVTGRSVDEYLATLIMLNDSDIYAGGFETLDVSTLATDEDKMRAVAKKIMNVSKDFTIPSVDNNKLGVLNVSAPENLLLVIKQELLNDIDVDFLSGIYNLSKVGLPGNIIPVRSFNVVVNSASGTGLTPSERGGDIDFVILDTRGFDCHVALQDGGMIYNPKGKYTNHFSNLWKIISYRYDFQARAYKLKRA